MLSSLYIDDFNRGKSNVLETKELYNKAKSRVKDGNFNLRKWNSNSKELMETIAREDSVVNNIAKISEEDATYARENLGERTFSDD